MKNNKKDERRGGFYFKDKVPYLSTTTILSILAKPAISYWMAREVYYAMVKDPTLDEKTALAAPYAVSDKAKARGTTIHSIIESFKTTSEEIEGIPQEFKNYATAFYSFIRDHNVEILEQEKTVFDEINRVAGTLDIYAKIGAKLHLIDVKTGKAVYNEVSLQLSSYANMLRLTGKTVDEISVLLLETGEDGLPTGKYVFKTLKENFPAFLAAKILYEWQNQDKLIKVGYKEVGA